MRWKSGKDLRADIGTKTLDGNRFEFLRQKFNFCNPLFCPQVTPATGLSKSSPSDDGPEPSAVPAKSVDFSSTKGAKAQDAPRRVFRRGSLISTDCIAVKYVKILTVAQAAMGALVPNAQGEPAQFDTIGFAYEQSALAEETHASPREFLRSTPWRASSDPDNSKFVCGWGVTDWDALTCRLKEFFRHPNSVPGAHIDVLLPDNQGLVRPLSDNTLMRPVDIPMFRSDIIYGVRPYGHSQAKTSTDNMVAEVTNTEHFRDVWTTGGASLEVAGELWAIAVLAQCGRKHAGATDEFR